MCNELPLNARVLFALVIKFILKTGRAACYLCVLSWDFSNLKGEMKGLNRGIFNKL